MVGVETRANKARNLFEWCVYEHLSLKWGKQPLVWYQLSVVFNLTDVSNFLLSFAMIITEKTVESDITYLLWFNLKYEAQGYQEFVCFVCDISEKAQL